MAVEKDIKIDCGSDYLQVIELTLSNGQPFPLFGYNARTQCRETFDSLETLWDFSTELGTIGLGDGVLSFKVPPQTSDAVQEKDIKRAIWDIELVAPSGSVTRLAGGKVSFTFQVTR